MAESQLEAENEANNQVNMKEIEDKKITEKIITMALSIKEVISYLKIYFLLNEKLITLFLDFRLHLTDIGMFLNLLYLIKFFNLILIKI